MVSLAGAKQAAPICAAIETLQGAADQLQGAIDNGGQINSINAMVSVGGNDMAFTLALPLSHEDSVVLFGALIQVARGRIASLTASLDAIS